MLDMMDLINHIVTFILLLMNKGGIPIKTDEPNIIKELDEVEFDIFLFLAYSLANNSLLSKDIDKIYEKHKFKAYEVAKRSPYYNSPLFTDGSINKQVLSRKALGIIGLKVEGDLDVDITIDLFKKGWPSIYNYIKKTDIIDVKHIVSKLMKSDGSDDYYVGCTIAILYISAAFDKEIDDNDSLDYTGNVLGMLNEITDNYKDKNRYSFKVIKRDKQSFDKALAIKDRFKDMLIFDVFDTSALNPLNFSDKEIARYCNSLSLIFDSEFMMFSSMTGNMKIEDKDIIELAYLYFLDNGNMNRIDSAKFIISGLFIKYVTKAYMSLKDYFFKNNKETLYFEMDKLTNDNTVLENDKRSLEVQIKGLRAELDRVKKEYKDTLEKDNIRLNRENKMLENELELLKNENIETSKLIESFFNDNSIDDEDIEEIEVTYTLPNMKCVIAGGHSGWHDKIKDELPGTFDYIVGSNERFDEKILDNKEIVFIYTKYMSHAFYYKLISKCKRSNITTYYISANSSNKLKKEIYSIINK